ncbi:MAG: hypothetical protein IKE10_03355 [Bacilli bacterium]|nr:hypothetical protein [Bacilli bacterium]
MEKSKEVILDNAKNYLNTLLDDIKTEYDNIREFINNYVDNNNEEDDVDSIYTPQIKRKLDKIKEFEEKGQKSLGQIYKTLEREEIAIGRVLGYNPLMGDAKGFVPLMQSVCLIDPKKSYETILIVSKISGLDYPFSQSDFIKYNDAVVKAFAAQQDALTYDETDYIPEMDHVKIMRSVQDALKKYDFDTFFDKNFNFVEKAIAIIEDKKIDYTKSIQDERVNQLNIRKQEKENELKEYNERVIFLDNKRKQAKETLNLISEYETSLDPDLYKTIIHNLLELDAISYRQAKINTYEQNSMEIINDPDDVNNIIDNLDITIKAPSEAKELLEKPAKELDADYFRNPDAENIICFLGETGDTIIEDLYRHFDNSTRKPVLKELISLFESLSVGKEHSSQLGSYPKETTENRKTTTLLKAPFRFQYRRYGVSKDDYRIHAITKRSSILQELGYGNGNIIFFGSIGYNDDKKKSFSYSRVGARAIESFPASGEKAILKSNFNDIEHILRRYIPVNLLCDEDKTKFERGKFRGVNKKLNKDRSIERNQYVLFDELENQSKENVRLYLNKYFIEQTNIMFKIIEDYKRRDNTLD